MKLTIDKLQKVCERLPGDFKIVVVTSKGKTVYLNDIIEVDLSNNTLILKE